MALRDNVAGTSSNSFAVGDGSAGDKSLLADNGAANPPLLKWNDTTKRWQVSADGTNFWDLPKANFAAAVNPTVSNDGTQGYAPGSQWINTVNGTEWVCISNGTGAAVWKNCTAGAGALVQKAGVVLNASFAGNPKKATVTFATPFADANYAVVLTAETTGNIAYIPVVESKVAGSFVIDVTANNIPNLTAINWIATKTGEST